MDALNEMNSAVSLLVGNQEQINNLQAKFTELQSFILTNENAEDIKLKIAELEDAIGDNGQIFANTTNLLNLIQRNYTEITNIYQNQTSVEMAYNLDILIPGPGIDLDKSQAGQVKFINKNQMFNLGAAPLTAVLTDFAINPESYSQTRNLLEYTNYVKITDGTPNNPAILDRDVIIYVDDTVTKWQKGQVYRISFANGIDLDNTNGKFNFIVYTDAADALNTGFAYSAEAAFITYLDFEKRDNVPTIEIICINPATYEFTVDIF
jgi:hypothetical protein